MAANAGSSPVAGSGGLRPLFAVGAMYMGSALPSAIDGKGLLGDPACFALGKPLGGLGLGLCLRSAAAGGRGSPAGFVLGAASLLGASLRTPPGRCLGSTGPLDAADPPNKGVAARQLPSCSEDVAALDCTLAPCCGVTAGAALDAETPVSGITGRHLRIR